MAQCVRIVYNAIAKKNLTFALKALLKSFQLNKMLRKPLQNVNMLL